jgi:hypothetical protein
MPENGNFTGAGFSLSSLTLPAPATLRLRYTQDPLAASSVGVHDALNPANYSITGTSVVAISVINGTSGNTQSVDIQLSAPLPTGTYTVTVTNVQTAGAASLTAPTSLNITTTFTGNPDPVNGGAVTDSAEDLIRKHLSPALKGHIWSSLISAVATGDDNNFTNADLAFDQLFRSTASGIYLDRKLGDDGIRRPTGIGMSDATFSKYGIAINAHKLTQNAFLDVLEIFYGSDAVRAHADTVPVAPFALSGGEVLNILLDELIAVTVTFAVADFAQPGQATAIEVAASLTRNFELNGVKAYAIALKDAITGLSRVRIYSGSHGLRSAVRITSGLANTVLQFPTQIVTPPIGTTPSTVTWTVSIPSKNVARWTVSSGAVDLSQIRVGDYVNIIGANFSAVNRGSFVITNVNVSYTGGVTLLQYFDVVNAVATAQGPLAEINLSDVFFFRPTKQSIQVASGRTVIVAQDDETAVDVQLPATTLAVTRTADTGAYIEVHPALASITSVSRSGGIVTVTAPSHGLSIGNQIFVDGVYGSSTAPSIVAGSQSTTGNPGTTDASLLTIASLVRAPDILNVIYHTATLQTDGKVLIAGGLNTDSQTAGAGTQSACDRFTLTGSSILGGGQVQWTYNWINTASMPSTTNFMQRSQLMTNAVWTQTRETTTAAAGIVGPDGNTTNVFKVADDATAGATHQTTQGWTPNSTGFWTNSVYARAGSLTWIVLSTDNGTTFAYFQLSGAGTLGSTGGGATSAMTPVGYGWYRCSITSILVSGVAKTASYGLATANNTQVFNGGGGTNFVYLWAPQVEAGSFPTYIVPTPASATVTAANALQWQSALVATTGSNSGNTLTFGGYNNNQTPVPAFFSPAIYSYNNTGNSWATAIPFLSKPRCRHNTKLLTDGRVMVVGGATTPTNATTSTEILAADQTSVAAGPSLNEARAGADSITLSDGRMIVIGGQALSIAAFNDANVLAYWPFDEMDTGFTAADSGTNAYNLTDVASLTLADAGGKINFARTFAAGGHMTATGNATAISGLLGSWTIEAWVDGISLGTLNQQQVIVSYEGAAGAGGNGNILAQLWVEQQTSNILVGWTWQNGVNNNVTGNTSIPTPPGTYKWHHVAITKSGTTVFTYFDGALVNTSTGNVNASNGSTSIWHVGLGNQSTGQFKGRLDDLRISFIPRTDLEVFKTWRNGRGDLNLVFSGGTTPPNMGSLVASIEIGNGSSWKPGGNMSIARAGHRAALLPNNRILICGGFGYTNRQPLPTTLQSSAEIWDPNTRTCQPAGNMVVARAYHTAVYLASINKVLVLGGYTAASNQNSIFEYYDLNTNTWSAGVTALHQDGSADGGPFTNDAHAVAMTGGPVLITGGKSRSGVATPMEILIPASDQVEAGNINGIQTVATVPSGSVFTFLTPSTSSYTFATSGMTITPMGAVFSKIPGPFSYDTKGGIGITSVTTTLNQAIFKGQQYANLTVASSAAFPDAPGWICIGFGYSNSTFPVKYLGRFSATALSLDYSFVFPADIATGASVTLLNGSGIYVPASPTKVGSFYLTDSNSGRVAAQSTIEAIDGAGLNVNISVVYPGDIGLGGAGLGAVGQKFSDEVLVWGSNNLDEDEANARST